MSVGAFAEDRFITGWQAKYFVIADVSTPGGQELFRVDCGSWHRVHDVCVTDNSFTVIHAFKTTIRLHCGTSGVGHIGAISGCGVGYHGLTVNDVCCVAPSSPAFTPVVFTASDDLTLHMHSLPLGTSTRLSLQGHLCTVRCIATAACVTNDREAVVVSGGGRDTLLCWRVGWCPDVPTPPRVEWMCSAVRDIVEVDQRILGVTIVPLQQCVATAKDVGDSFIIVCGNSNGLLSLFLLPWHTNTLVLLAEHQPSDKPVLCVDHLVSGHSLLCVVGCTDGCVYVVDCGAAIAAAVDIAAGDCVPECYIDGDDAVSGDGGDSELDGMAGETSSRDVRPQKTRKPNATQPTGDDEVCVASVGAGSSISDDAVMEARAAPAARSLIALSTPLWYSAHEMGTNCVATSMLHLDTDADGCHNALIVSGGDDQGITACVVTLNTARSHCAVKRHITFRYPGVAVAAFTGIAIHHNMVVAVGIDQRLSVWSVDSSALRSATADTVDVPRDSINTTPTSLLRYRESVYVDTSNVSGVALRRAR